MRRAGRITYALMSFAMLFATTAFAADKGSLHVQSTTMAGTTQLPAGEYTVQWEGPGPDVELKIKLHNRVKGTVPAKVTPLDQPLREDAAARMVTTTQTPSKYQTGSFGSRDAPDRALSL